MKDLPTDTSEEIALRFINRVIDVAQEMNLGTGVALRLLGIVARSITAHECSINNVPRKEVAAKTLSAFFQGFGEFDDAKNKDALH